jgi:ElaB/YqjD/DUF883 family membrane-anchored ribosome-binding protein
MASTMSTGESYREETGDNVLVRARERVSSAYQNVKDRGLAKEQELEGYVKDHPMSSVLLAIGLGAGLGLIAGVLLGRR